jgi:hypothetical protein
MTFLLPLPATPKVLLTLALVAPPGPLAARAHPSISIHDIDVGSPGIGSNPFRATLVNNADTAVLAVLDLRATPGMWLLRNQQAQFGYHLQPKESRRIEATYVFERMSPEARLRVRLGPGHRADAGYLLQDTVTFERWYPVGQGNPAALDVTHYFVVRKAPPFEVFAWKGSLAAIQIDAILRTRRAAVDAVRAVMNVEPPERIRLVFYPDSATKVNQTGHVGLGMTRDSTIVEIYNEHQQLDPYHELAHVLTGQIGDVPAMFNEGLAVYISEHLGADALQFLGDSGHTVYQAACRDLRAGTSFPLDSLSALPDIGPAETRPSVAYPEAASVVRYLIETYGVDKFRAIYRDLADAEGSEAERTSTVLKSVLGISVARLERGWRREIETHCDLDQTLHALNMGNEVAFWFARDDAASVYVLSVATTPDGPWEAIQRIEASELPPVRIPSTVDLGGDTLTGKSRTETALFRDRTLYYRMDLLDAGGNIIRTYPTVTVPPARP